MREFLGAQVQAGIAVMELGPVVQVTVPLHTVVVSVSPSEEVEFVVLDHGAELVERDPDESDASHCSRHDGSANRSGQLSCGVVEDGAERSRRHPDVVALDVGCRHVDDTDGRTEVTHICDGIVDGLGLEVEERVGHGDDKVVEPVESDRLPERHLVLEFVDHLLVGVVGGDDVEQYLHGLVQHVKLGALFVVEFQYRITCELDIIGCGEYREGGEVVGGDDDFSVVLVVFEKDGFPLTGIHIVVCSVHLLSLLRLHRNGDIDGSTEFVHAVGQAEVNGESP